MNAGYVSVIKEMFPKANIIIEPFHLVQLIKIRVQVMNALKTSNNEDIESSFAAYSKQFYLSF